MADVFKARVQGPAGFERVFVVKRILPHLCDDPTFTRMFIDEAKMSARLNHPNIVQVFELGNVDSEYFISMEYVKGRDVAETMRTLWARVGPPRPELVAYIGREMCRALAYAHDLTADDGSPLGMIHRDVSPSNVMLSHEGAVKILDFGIAKALGGEKEETGTQRGTLKGKFAYMAPEQTQGSDVDKRIDIFATGIVLHEILTGRRLFKGENDLQTVEKVRQCDVQPPSLQNPLCPPELDEIILKALAKNRDDRFLTATDLADSLDDVVHSARFQPTHLAQLMRDLFPSDVGGTDKNPSNARVSQSLTGSSSRPHSSALRSPTVPPVSAPRNPASQINRPATQDVSQLALPRAKKPLWQRGTVWAAAAAVGAAFAGGVVFNQKKAPAPTAGVGSAASTPSDRPKSTPFTVLIRSSPDRADVYDLATNKKLGTTDFYGKFDAPTKIIYRLKGYLDAVKEIRPGFPAFSTLKPDPTGRGNSKTEIVQQPSPVPQPPAGPAIVEPVKTGGKAGPAGTTTPARKSDSPGKKRGSGDSKKAARAGEVVDPFSR